MWTRLASPHTTTTTTTATSSVQGQTMAIPLSGGETVRQCQWTEQSIPLLQFPQELVLLIFEWLPEPELLILCEVSSETRQLALSTLLARYGVSEAQIEAQELTSVSSRAIRSLCASYPTPIPNIRRLDINLTDGDVNHLRPWRALMHLAERFPVIPCVTFRFPDGSAASGRYPGLWNSLPATLIALMGQSSRPVVIIHHLNVTAVQPRLPIWPILLKRALVTPKLGPRRQSSVSSQSAATPVIDRMKLTRKLLSSISTASTRRLLSQIYLRSFTESSSPLGALVVLNPATIFYLDIGEHILPRPELQFLLSELHLPALRTLFIRIDFEHQALSAFLEKHNTIEHLDFFGDWSCPDDGPPFSAKALPRLKHLSANSRTIARILAAPNAFPQLAYVGIGSRSAPTALVPVPDAAHDVDAALHALAPRASVTTLMLFLHGLEAPWADFDLKTKRSRVERELRSVEALHLSQWTYEVQHAAFPAWLALFSGLQDLVVSGTLVIGKEKEAGPLIPKRFLEAINTVCPRVVVKQERRLDL